MHVSMQLPCVPKRFGMCEAHRARLPMISVPRGFRRCGTIPVLSREPLALLRTLSAGWCSCVFREWQLGSETSSPHDRRMGEMRVSWVSTPERDTDILIALRKERKSNLVTELSRL